MHLRVGIVGCGDIFEHHRRGWTRVRDCDIRGIYDIDQSLSRRLAQESRVGKAFPSIEQLLDECNVVDVCTPPDSHFEIAMAAAEAGCHLLIEKPVLPSLRDWGTLWRRVEASGLKVAALHNQKYFGVNRRAKHWVDTGRIGRIVRVFDQHMVTPDNDWMLGAQGHWSHRLPGGRWLETLPHNLYMLHLFAGPLEPTHVAITRGPGTCPGAQADEVVLSLAGDTCLSTIHFSASCTIDRRSMVLTGTEGTIEVFPPGRVATHSRMRLDFWKKAVGLPYLEAGQKLVQMVPDRIDFLRDQLAPLDAHGRNIVDFAEYLRDAGPSPTPASEIEYVIRVCEIVGGEIESKLNSRGSLFVESSASPRS